MADHKHHPADTLEEIESLGTRLAQWVGANPVLVLGVLGTVLLVAAGVGGYRAWSGSHADAASAAFAELRTEFVTAMGGKPTDVDVPEPANPETARTTRSAFADRYLAFAGEWGGTASGAVAAIEAGELFLELGNPGRALEIWSQAVAEAPAESPLIGILQTRIGHQQEEQGDLTAAARAFEAAAAIPGYPLRPDALAAAARCWAEAGEPDQALARYQELKSESGDFQLAPHIEARLEELAVRRASLAADGAAAPPAPTADPNPEPPATP